MLVNWGPFDERKIEKGSLPKKKRKGGPLGFFNIDSAVNLQEMKGNPLGNFFGKSPQCRKKSKWGTLRSRPVLYVTQETFLVLFPGPTGEI